MSWKMKRVLVGHGELRGGLSAMELVGEWEGDSTVEGGSVGLGWGGVVSVDGCRTLTEGGVDGVRGER